MGQCTNQRSFCDRASFGAWASSMRALPGVCPGGAAPAGQTGSGLGPSPAVGAQRHSAGCGSFNFSIVRAAGEAPAGAGDNPKVEPDVCPGGPPRGAVRLRGADGDPALGVKHQTPYGAATLLGCLHRFVRPESLGPGERWTCGRCQAERRAVKQMSIRRLPPVLCLHVKRFEHTVRDVTLPYPVHRLEPACYWLLGSAVQVHQV